MGFRAVIASHRPATIFFVSKLNLTNYFSVNIVQRMPSKTSKPKERKRRRKNRSLFVRGLIRSAGSRSPQFWKSLSLSLSHSIPKIHPYELFIKLLLNFNMEGLYKWFRPFNIRKWWCIRIYEFLVQFNCIFDRFKMNSFSIIYKWDILIDYEEVYKSHIFLYTIYLDYGNHN